MDSDKSTTGKSVSLKIVSCFSYLVIKCAVTSTVHLVTVIVYYIVNDLVKHLEAYRELYSNKYFLFIKPAAHVRKELSKMLRKADSSAISSSVR